MGNGARPRLIGSYLVFSARLGYTALALVAIVGEAKLPPEQSKHTPISFYTQSPPSVPLSRPYLWSEMHKHIGHPSTIRPMDLHEGGIKKKKKRKEGEKTAAQGDGHHDQEQQHKKQKQRAQGGAGEWRKVAATKPTSSGHLVEELVKKRDDIGNRGSGKMPFADFFDSLKRQKSAEVRSSIDKREEEEQQRGKQAKQVKIPADSKDGDSATQKHKKAKEKNSCGGNPNTHVTGHIPSETKSSAGKKLADATGLWKEGEGRDKGAKGEIPFHPFDTEYGDHFETGDRAYSDIAPLLGRLAQLTGKDKARFSIYDPYYCAGGVISRMKVLGFHNVYNRNEDCYQVWREKRSPKYDVLMTNPPFSGDHKERCLRHCVQSGRPWAVVLPNYCATKDYFQKITEPCKDGLFFGIPRDTYQFEHPEGTGHKSSPFFSLWFVCFGSHSRTAIEWYRKTLGDRAGLRLCTSVAELGASKGVSLEKRLNPRQRKALKKKRMSAAAQA